MEVVVMLYRLGLIVVMAGLMFCGSTRPADAAVQRDPAIVKCAAVPTIASVAQVEPTALACYELAVSNLQYLLTDRLVQEVTVALVVAAGTSYAACACDALGLVNRLRVQARLGAAGIYRWFVSPGPRRNKSRGVMFAAGCAAGVVHAYADRLMARPGSGLNAREWWKLGSECVTGGMFAAWKLS